MIRTPLVRGGVDAWLFETDARGNTSWVPNRDKWTPEHTFFNVHIEMFLQVLRDYSSLPDPRTLRAREVRFLYNALRPELKKHTGSS